MPAYDLEIRVTGSAHTSELERVNRSLRKIENQIRQTNGLMKQGGAAARGMGNKMQFASILIGNVLADLVQEARYAFQRFIKDSDKAAREFDQNWRQIMTIVDQDAKQSFSSLRDDVRLLNLDLGRTAKETLPAIYQGLSRGIDEENVLDDVATASDAARAGAADLNDTLVAGQNVINAYKDGAYDLNEVYDIMFKSIDLGAITMRDFSEGVSEAIATGAEAGVQFEDIAAALVTMTNQGDSFNESIELTGLLLTQLTVSGTAASDAFKEAAGQSFPAFIQSGHSLAEALQLLQTHADSTGQALIDLIAGDSKFYRDQQAARAALELTGVHMEDFIETSERIKTEAAGSMEEAADIMNDSWQRIADDTKAAKAELKLALGEALHEGIFGFGTADARRALTKVLNQLSGADTRRLGAQLESELEEAKTVQETIEQIHKLRTDDYWLRETEATQVPFTPFHRDSEVLKSQADAIRQLVEQSRSLPEFRKNLEKAGFDLWSPDVGFQAGNEFIGDTDLVVAEIYDKNAKAAAQYEFRREQLTQAIIKAEQAERSLAATSAKVYEDRVFGIKNARLETQRGAEANSLYHKSITELGDKLGAASKSTSEYTKKIEELEASTTSLFQQLVGGAEVDLGEQMFNYAVEHGAEINEAVALAKEYTQASDDQIRVWKEQAELQTEQQKLWTFYQENFKGTTDDIQLLIAAERLLRENHDLTAEAAVRQAARNREDLTPSYTELTSESNVAKAAVKGVNKALDETPEETSPSVDLDDDQFQKTFEGVKANLAFLDGWSGSGTWTLFTSVTGIGTPYQGPYEDPTPDETAAHGLDMVIPPGYSEPHNPFVIHAQSGERVNITPGGGPPAGEAYYDQRQINHHYHNEKSVAIARALEDDAWEQRGNEWMPE